MNIAQMVRALNAVQRRVQLKPTALRVVLRTAVAMAGTKKQAAAAKNPNGEAKPQEPANQRRKW